MLDNYYLKLQNFELKYFLKNQGGYLDVVTIGKKITQKDKIEFSVHYLALVANDKL
jgi:hypothetical protein